MGNTGPWMQGLHWRRCWSISGLKDVQFRPFATLYDRNTPALRENTSISLKIFSIILNSIGTSFKKWEQPPSGVSAMSWARNCPNCMAMCVNPFEPAVVLPPLPTVLCISFDTFRGLTFTCTYKMIWSLSKQPYPTFVGNFWQPCAASKDRGFQVVHKLERPVVSFRWQLLPNPWWGFKGLKTKE